jgi:hypothetical protein
MGVVVLAAIALYLLIAFGVVRAAVVIARKNGRGTIRWGLGAALVMYLIPLWDWLPTLIAEKYYCANESGLFVYKTADAWKQENPGVLETLSVAHLPERYRAGSDPTFKKYPMYELPDGTSLRARFDVKGRLMHVEYKTLDGEKGSQLNERFRLAHRRVGPELLKLARDEYVLIDTKTTEVLARQVDFKKATEGRLGLVPGDSWWKFWLQSYNSCVNDYPQQFGNGGIWQYVIAYDADCPQKSARETEAERDGVKISCPRRP